MPETSTPSFIKFGRAVILMKKLPDGQTADDGKHGITIAHHEHYVLRCAKNRIIAVSLHMYC